MEKKNVCALHFYLKTEGDATPAAHHLHRVRPVESGSMTRHASLLLPSYGVFFYQDQILYTALTAGELQR